MTCRSVSLYFLSTYQQSKACRICYININNQTNRPQRWFLSFLVVLITSHMPKSYIKVIIFQIRFILSSCLMLKRSSAHHNSHLNLTHNGVKQLYAQYLNTTAQSTNHYCTRCGSERHRLNDRDSTSVRSVVLMQHN